MCSTSVVQSIELKEIFKSLGNNRRLDERRLMGSKGSKGYYGGIEYGKGKGKGKGGDYEYGKGKGGGDEDGGCGECPAPAPVPDTPVAPPASDLPIPFDCPADLPPINVNTRSGTQTECTLVIRRGRVIPSC